MADSRHGHIIRYRYPVHTLMGVGTLHRCFTMDFRPAGVDWSSLSMLYYCQTIFAIIYQMTHSTCSLLFQSDVARVCTAEKYSTVASAWKACEFIRGWLMQELLEDAHLYSNGVYKDQQSDKSREVSIWSM